ncbi:MAG: hypothetical protein AABY16_01680 [Nanoarchaeota archaeon]
MDRKTYDDFMADFTGRLKAEHPNVCFYGYGSYFRNNGDFNPDAESDIDGGLVLDSGIVTPKDKVRGLGELLADCLSRNRVPVQFNLIDRESSTDGRFLSYTEDYTRYLKSRGLVVSGPDYIREMNGLDYKSGTLNSVSFDLRGVRNRNLNCLDRLEFDKETFIEDLRWVIRHVSKSPKKLVWLQGENEIITNNIQAIRRLQSILSNFDISMLMEFDGLRRVPRSDRLWEDEERCLEFYRKGLESIEMMIKAYVDASPEITEREIANR